MEQVQFPSIFPVMIRSDKFQNNILRMEGIQNAEFNPQGFGTVNCQVFDNVSINQNAFEIFNFQRNDDDTVSFQSHAFPGNFLRMAGVNNPQFNPNGFGSVDCQASIGSFEKFQIHVLADNDQDGVPVSIESVAFPSNFLRLEGINNPPSYNPSGFGTVNCQASVSDFEKFHLGTVLSDAIDELLTWFPQNPAPTKAEIEEMIASIITKTEISNSNVAAAAHPFGFMAMTDEERAAIDAIDLSQFSDCAIAIVNLVIDILLFVLSIMGIIVIKTDKMIKAAITAIGESLDGLSTLIVALKNASSVPAQAVILFNIISQVFTLSGFKAILKTILNGFSWFSAILAAISIVAQIIAWIATDGILFLFQVILAATALITIIADATKVSNTCNSNQLAVA